MHRNPYWLFYILLILVVVLTYTGFTFFKIYRYSLLSEEVAPQNVHWAISKIADDDFVLQSVYEFSWKGKNYTGRVDEGEHYLNAWAGREALERLKSRTFTVWFDPNNPSISTLDKVFPIKYSIYAGLLWLLFFYFVRLGYMITNKPR